MKFNPATMQCYTSVMPTLLRLRDGLICSMLRELNTVWSAMHITINYKFYSTFTVELLDKIWNWMLECTLSFRVIPFTDPDRIYVYAYCASGQVHARHLIGIMTTAIYLAHTCHAYMMVNGHPADTAHLDQVTESLTTFMPRTEY
jgi:hypothetical protein